MYIRKINGNNNDVPTKEKSPSTGDKVPQIKILKGIFYRGNHDEIFNRYTCNASSIIGCALWCYHNKLCFII